MTFKTELGQIAKAIYENSIRQGWWVGSNPESRTPEELRFKIANIGLMHSELGEATEGVRKPRSDDHCPQFSNEVIELADTVMRIIDYCKHYHLPLAEAIEAKIAANALRPFKHGKEY